MTVCMIFAKTITDACGCLIEELYERSGEQLLGALLSQHVRRYCSEEHRLRDQECWHRVVFAADLPGCRCCSEPFCDWHQKHYVDCPCIGPHQDEEYEYQERLGVLYARLKQEQQNYEL